MGVETLGVGVVEASDVEVLLEEATLALTEFAVERLEQVALTLDAILARRGHLSSTAELAARHKVFAGVLQATGDNLGVLQRLAGESSSRAGIEWAR